MKLLFEKEFPTGWFRSFDEKPSGVFSSVHQVHSNVVLPVETEQLAEQKADGIVGPATASLAIKTADCLPVLVIGSHGIGLLHAGWRGLADGILTAAAVRELAPTAFFIGPCIRSCCFQVTSEFQAHFSATPVQSMPDGTLHFDLVHEAYRQLSATFPNARVNDSGECTCCNMKYPSFRRDKTPQRIWNLWVPLAQ